MYNLTVAEAHTFYVGQGQWLVHNDPPVKPGVTVLGHYPEYIERAKELNARIFQIPSDQWDRLFGNDSEKAWEANRKFLDRTIQRGDVVELATPTDKVRPGSFFERELKYLFEKGYTLSEDGKRLLPPKGGC